MISYFSLNSKMSSNINHVVTEMQHTLSDHLLMFQEFVNNLNNDGRVNDAYRQHICSVIKQLDNAIFNAYKMAADLRAYLDFSILPNESQIKIERNPQEQQHSFRPPINR